MALGYVKVSWRYGSSFNIPWLDSSRIFGEIGKLPKFRRKFDDAFICRLIAAKRLNLWKRENSLSKRDNLLKATQVSLYPFRMKRGGLAVQVVQRHRFEPRPFCARVQHADHTTTANTALAKRRAVKTTSKLDGRVWMLSVIDWSL